MMNILINILITLALLIGVIAIWLIIPIFSIIFVTFLIGAIIYTFVDDYRTESLKEKETDSLD